MKKLNIHIIFYLNNIYAVLGVFMKKLHIISVLLVKNTFISTNSYNEAEDFSEASRSVRMCRKLDYLF